MLQWQFTHPCSYSEHAFDWWLSAEPSYSRVYLIWTDAIVILSVTFERKRSEVLFVPLTVWHVFLFIYAHQTWWLLSWIQTTSFIFKATSWLGICIISLWIWFESLNESNKFPSSSTVPLRGWASSAHLVNQSTVFLQRVQVQELFSLVVLFSTCFFKRSLYMCCVALI